MKQSYHFLMILFISCFTTKLYSQSVPSYVPTNGLVGWWGFNGNAQDGSGNGNHGTVNGATLTTDRFGNANSSYTFNGFSNYIECISNGTLQISNSYSISLWFNSNIFNNGQYGYTLLSKITPTGWYGGYEIMIGESNSIGGVNHTGNINGNFQLPYSGLSAGNWYSVIITFDGNQLKLFIDGFLVNTVSQSGSLQVGNYPLRFGRRGGGGIYDQWYNGSLDDIGIWNRALTPQEITNLYNSQLPTQTSLCLPTITTSSPTSVGVDSVVIGGDISNDGGSSIVLRGICYSTSPNPNMGNMRTENGTGIGSFNTVLRGLNPSSTYYARSYAKNSNGVVVYGNEVSISTSSINIGSNYAGGIVFYIDSTGQHGLVCAPSGQGGFLWGCWGTNIGGTSTAMGTGQTNTNLILSGCSDRPIAASVCENLVLNGYSDWYLPSLAELQLMGTNLHAQGIGGFISNSAYWSSSQLNSNYAWVLTFNISGVSTGNYAKNSFANQVRAVRAF